MILKGNFINEIGDGDRVKAVFLVSERRLLTARNGKPYGKIILSDKTGDILGMVWDEAQEQVSLIAPGDVVGVRASAESYENRLQLRIEKITKLSDQEVDITSLVPSASRDITTMVDEFELACNSIKNPHLRLLIERIFAREGVREGFMKAPAAKGIHHNYIGGLLEHSLFILRTMSALLPVYAHMGFNRDMLVVGPSCMTSERSTNIPTPRSSISRPWAGSWDISTFPRTWWIKLHQVLMVFQRNSSSNSST